MLPLLLALTMAAAPPWASPIVFAASGDARRAPGEPGEPERLEWEAPAGCPDAEALGERVQALSGRDLGPSLRVLGTVAPSDTGFDLELHIHLGDRVETRHLASPSCDELTDAAALVIAAALGEDVYDEDELAALADGLPPRAPRTLPPSRPATTRESPSLRRTTVSKARRRSTELRLELGGGLGLGALPGVSGGPRLGLGLQWPRARLEARGTYFAPRRAELQRDSGVVVSGGVAELRGCGRIRVRRIEIPLCLGAEAGALRGRGYGLAPSRRSLAPWFAPTAAGALRYAPTARIGLWAELQVAVPIVRPRFVSAPADASPSTIFRPRVVDGRLFLGLDVVWGITR